MEDRERSRGAERSREEEAGVSTVDFLSGSPVISAMKEQYCFSEVLPTVVRKALLAQKLAERCLQTLMT